MNKLSDSIKSGARAFLITEYKYLSIFVGVVAILLLILYSVDPPPKSDETIDGLRYSCCFLGGAILSALAGWQGMDVATDANVRTTQAADKKGLSVALRVAFTGGAVMGFTVVGLGLFGVSLFFYFMTLGRSGEESIQIVNAVDALSGFGFGASAIALFARVAGGIYTKVCLYFHPQRFSIYNVATTRCTSTLLTYPPIFYCNIRLQMSEQILWEKLKWTSPRMIPVIPPLLPITSVTTLVM